VVETVEEVESLLEEGGDLAAADEEGAVPHHHHRPNHLLRLAPLPSHRHQPQLVVQGAMLVVEAGSNHHRGAEAVQVAHPSVRALQRRLHPCLVQAVLVSPKSLEDSS
jgi:hypothetical protein